MTGIIPFLLTLGRGSQDYEIFVGSLLTVLQVWPLTPIYFCFLFVEIIDLPGGQSNDPLSGKYFYLPFLPATPSSLSRTFEGLLELTQRPSRDFNLAMCVVSGTTDNQGHREVCFAGGRGPRTV